MTNSDDGGVVKTILFPEISTLDFNFDLDYQDKAASEWAVVKIGHLEGKIQKYLAEKRNKSNSRGFNKDEIPYHKLINLAKDSFGFDGWKDEVIDTTVTSHEQKPGDEAEEVRHTVVVESIVRIILKDGTYHDELGVGRSHNMPHKSLAFMKAKKESITDGKKKGLHALKNILFEYEDRKRVGGFYNTNVFA